MGQKNYGPGVSGYLDPTGRNYETAVFQAGRPLLDKELNLCADLEPTRNPWRPSGWITSDPVATSRHVPYFMTSGVSNAISVRTLYASVNGWSVIVDKTFGSSNNSLDLGAGPVGVGTHRTDLIVLEVWRRLVSASPDNTGKSPSGRIWLNGNVKLFDPGNPSLDITTNLSDDLLDLNVGSETTKRVQIQYRLRVVQGVDLLNYPMGIDDPTVLARTVPQSALAPDGEATAFVFSSMSVEGDPGLWKAGDGNPTNALGTVDGYIYGLPLCAVFRRNTSAFDRNSNHNGGASSPGPSTRPDGLLADIIVEDDVADIRHCIPVPGSHWDYKDILDKSVNAILDNNLKTEWANTIIGGGTWGHTLLWADEIGVSTANGGDGVINGDTPGAAFVGEFDNVRREFSDRAIFEIVTLKYSSAGWSSGDSFTIDPTALPIYPYGIFNWASFAPSTATFVDILRLRFIGSDSSHISADGALKSITNLGDIPQTAITLTLGAIPPGVTDEDLYVDLAILYPPGRGLSKTAVQTFGSQSVTINNPAQLPATSPIYYDQLVYGIDAVHREVSLRYTTVTLSISISADGTETVVLPERADNILSMSVSSIPVYGSLDSSGRVITLTSPVATGNTIDIDFVAIRPLPQNLEQLTIWYQTRAVQTIRDGNLPASVDLLPRRIADHAYTLTMGSGSEGESYPFPMAYVQSGAIKTQSGVIYTGDHEMNSRAYISVSNFNADTGWLRLPIVLPMALEPDKFTIERGGSGDADSEGRTFFPVIDTGGYLPNAYAQDLTETKKHKVFVPIIAELKEDTAFGKKGQLLVAFVTRWAAMDATNGVWFTPDPNDSTTCVSLFRTLGNPLDGRSF